MNNERFTETQILMMGVVLGIAISLVIAIFIFLILNS
jgi:high-affinity Fe2+/Pb2+ permease